MYGISFFENLSVQRKIGLGFGLTSLLFIIVVWQYQVTLYRMLNSFEQLQSVHVAQKIHSLNIHRYMLEARRSEKDFLVRKGSEYVERVNKYVGLVLEEAAALQAIENQNDTPAVAERIRERMETYHEAFQNIVEAWQIKGLNYQSGLQGRFRETIHQVESKAESFRTGAIYLTLLQIRRAEKDLGLRRADEYASRVHDLGNRFKQQVGASELDAQSKDTLSGAMDDYLAAFDRYTARVMRDNDVAGGKGVFRDVAHHLEDLLRHHYVPDMEEDILMLRRHEKDYLLRGDKGYVEKARLVIRDILNNVSNSEIPDGEKDGLRDQMHEYEMDLLALVAQNDLIVALTKEMRNAVHQIEPLVTSNVQEATARVVQTGTATQEHAEKVAVVALSLSITAILLAVFFSVLIARRITRPVLTLVGLAELVAGSGDDSGAKGTKDEISILAAAMGRMAGHHRQMLSHLDGQKDRLVKVSSDIEALENSLAELSAEPMIAQTIRDKTGKDVLDLGDRLKQLREEMAEISGGLRKLLSREEVW